MAGPTESAAIEELAGRERGVLEAPRLLGDRTILFSDLGGGVFSLPPALPSRSCSSPGAAGSAGRPRTATAAP